MKDYVQELVLNDRFNSMTVTACLIYVLLLAQADKDYEVQCTETVGRSIGLNAESIENAVHELIDYGFIKKIGDVTYELCDFMGA